MRDDEPSAGPRRAILFCLWAFAFLSYLLRTNIAVAQQQMARELHWNDLQIGYVFTAFLVGYTLFQVPGGILGDHFGPRIVLGLAGTAWCFTTLLSGLVPGLLLQGPLLSLGSLLLIRFVHGIEESATYPVAMTAVADWFPAGGHSFVNSVIFTGSTLGSAFAPPLVAYLMMKSGWRTTFYMTAILPLALAAFWWRSTKGLGHRSPAKRRPDARSWLRLLRQKAVLALCTSYFLYCYAISIFVYWLFKYLVDVRHLTIVNSGWATSVPWIGASVTVPLLGYLSRRLSGRFGTLEGRRLIATVCLAVSAVLMFVGARAETIAVAIGAITMSVALLFSTEASYWATAISVAKDEAGASSGLMNLAGNLGGVLSTLLVPILAQHLGWFQALLSGSVFSVLAALVWFLVPSTPESQAVSSLAGSGSRLA